MKFRKVAMLLAAGGIGVTALAGCGSSNASTSTTEETTTSAEAVTTEAEETTEAQGAAAPGEAAGFTEYPLGDDQELEWADGSINVAGVYFQPVDMEPTGMGLAAADSDFHLEADISALENEVGYENGVFIPGLTVDYEIIPTDGAEQQEGVNYAKGTFMTMNASDGPHYGGNIKLTQGGTYTVKFTIHNPEENGWLLHTDEETGVTGRFWTSPLEAVFEDWNYAPDGLDWKN